VKFKDIQEIDNFESFIDELKFDNLEFIWDKTSLYHYTSSFALASIIKKKELWLSQSDYLNDRMEIKYTFNLAKDIIEGMLSDNPTTEELVFQETFKRYFNRNSVLFDAYILSLSKNPDSNLLWSNYSNNDGYNIEFEYPIIANNLQKQINSIYGKDVGTIQPYFVIYNIEQQKELLEKEIQDLYRIFLHCYKLNDDDLYRESMGTPMTNIFIYSLFFKDNCFAQEEEFRIALIVRKDRAEKPIYSCRTSNGVFIPYITIPFECSSEESPLNSVNIGPKNNLDIAEQGLRRFLDLNNYSDCIIKKSKIPYRY
jgi:hypothetical protein